MEAQGLSQAQKGEDEQIAEAYGHSLLESPGIHPVQLGPLTPKGLEASPWNGWDGYNCSAIFTLDLLTLW